MSDMASALAIRRLTLVAGVLTPCVAPVTVRGLTVGNGSAGDVLIYTTNDVTTDHYLIVQAGYERPLELTHDAMWRAGDTACWLYSASGGLVILFWS